MLEVAGKPFNAVMVGVRGKASTVVSGAKTAAKKVVLGVVLFVVILWVSVVLYASFYHIYVPTATIVRPAHFKFRACPSGVGMCSFPMANVTLGLENKAEVLGRGQQYLVRLHMQVPDSFPNRDLGMFMVMIRMYDRYGVITQESSRAVSLKYQSDLLKLIQTIVLSPLYITGCTPWGERVATGADHVQKRFADETQTLNINLYDFFWDDYYQPSVGVLLEIHSRQLVFYSAHLQFHAQYTGLRYYLFHYPVSSAFLGIVFNCLWLTPALLVPWYTLGLGLINGGNGAAPAPAPALVNAQGEEGFAPLAGGEGMGPGAEVAGGEERIDPGANGGEWGGRGDEEEGFMEVKAEERDVETVPRYCQQTVTFITPFPHFFTTTTTPTTTPTTPT